MKGVSETLKHEAKEQNGEFSGILLHALATGVLKNILGRKPKIPGWEVIEWVNELFKLVKEQ